MEKFKDLKYVRPDSETVEKALTSCIAEFEKAESFEQAHKAFLNWHKISGELETMYVIAYVRNTVNMKDEFYDGEIEYFNEAIPKLTPVMKKWGETIVKSQFRPRLEEIYGSHYFHTAEIENRLMNDEIIEPSIEENNISTEYSKTAASCSADWAFA